MCGATSTLMQTGMAQDEVPQEAPEPILLHAPDGVAGSLLRTFCLDAGWPSRTALGVEAVLEALDSEPPGVIIADPEAVGVTPEAFLRMVREATEELGPGEAPAVLLLALDDDAGSRLRALEAGADDVITRPLQRLEVQHRIGRALELRGARRHLATWSEDLARAARSLASVGDERDLIRDLVHEVAKARRADGSLTCVAVLPRHLPGLEDPAATSASALAVQATLRGSDRICLLGSDAVMALLPECDADGADATLTRLRRVLPPFPGFDLGYATLGPGDGQDGWDLLLGARRAALAAGVARASWPGEEPVAGDDPVSDRASARRAATRSRSG